jgi:hypothetical protein
VGVQEVEQVNWDEEDKEERTEVILGKKCFDDALGVSSTNRCYYSGGEWRQCVVISMSARAKKRKTRTRWATPPIILGILLW